jgi:hypothetical protein
MGNTLDLIVSPQHRMLISGIMPEVLFGAHEVLASAKSLCDGDQIYVREGGLVEYLHILLDQHEIIFAEGAPTESLHLGEYCANGVSHEARSELAALFPMLNGDITLLPTAVRPVIRHYETVALKQKRHAA